MKFMSIVLATPEHYGAPSPELMQAIGTLSERETKAGRMVGAGGLTPLNDGARVSVRQGRVVVQDGPFTETKEVIGGYAIFELASLDEAVTLAREFMQLHVEHMPGWEGTCEVRAMTDGDCG